MAFMTITSPHAHGPMTTAKIMQLVVLATLPGVFVMTWFFGFGTLVNIAVAAIVSLSLEALMMKMLVDAYIKNILDIMIKNMGLLLVPNRYMFYKRSDLCIL